MVTVHRQYPAKRVTGHGVNSNTGFMIIVINLQKKYCNIWGNIV